MSSDGIHLHFLASVIKDNLRVSLMSHLTVNEIYLRLNYSHLIRSLTPLLPLLHLSVLLYSRLILHCIPFSISSCTLISSMCFSTFSFSFLLFSLILFFFFSYEYQPSAALSLSYALLTHHTTSCTHSSPHNNT